MASEISQLTNELENIRKVMMSILSRSHQGESKRVVEKLPELNINRLPAAVLSQVLEFAFSLKSNLSTVSPQWKAHLENPKFWRLAIKDFNLYGIDPNQSPKEAFIERLQQNVSYYFRIFHNTEMPSGLNLLKTYEFYKKSDQYNAMNLLVDDGFKYSVEAICAFLDLQKPLSGELLLNLSRFSTEAQKEILRRVELFDPSLSQFIKEGVGIDVLLGTQFYNMQSEIENQKIAMSGSAKFDDILQRTIQAMRLIHQKKAEVFNKKPLSSEEEASIQPNVTSEFNFMLNEVEKNPEYLPILTTYLTLFSIEPLSREFIARAQALEDKELNEALEKHPIIND